MFHILSFLLSLIGIAALCAACFLAGFVFLLYLMTHQYGAEKTKKAIDRLKEYDINPIVTDSWADAEVAKHEYGVELVPWEEVPKADCVIVAVGHNQYRNMSMMQIKDLFKTDIPDEEKVLIDVKSLYRMDELKASGMRFWRL